MLRRVWPAAAALILGCAAPPAHPEAAGDTNEAITNGETSADAAVVALVASVGGEEVAYCTGTVVAPRVVLTAAHCVRLAHPAAVAFGAIATRTAERAGIAEIASPEGADLAILRLERDAPAAPIPIVDRPMDPSFVGRVVRVVGFGTPAANADPDATRRTGEARIDRVEDADFTALPDPSQPCTGDSGGPALIRIDDHDAVAGVTSAGDPDCALYARFTRVDGRAADFIAPFVAQAPPSGCAAGARSHAPPWAALLVVAALTARGRPSRRRRATSAGRR